MTSIIVMVFIFHFIYAQGARHYKRVDGQPRFGTYWAFFHFFLVMAKLFIVIATASIVLKVILLRASLYFS